LHRHNWLSFGKFQDTERFLIHCARHFSSRLPPSGGTCKYAKAPSTKKTLRDSLPIDMLLSAVSVLVVAQSSSEVPEGLMNSPVHFLSYLAQFFLEWEMFQTKGVEKIKTHILCSVTFFCPPWNRTVLWDNVVKCNKAGEAADNNMALAHCMPDT